MFDLNFNQLDYKTIEEKLINFIRSKAGNQKIIMGLSGGIDSSVSCYLANKALGKDNVKVVIIINTQFSKEGIAVARAYATKMGVVVQEVDSDNIRDSILKNIGENNPDLILQATVDVRLCDLIIRTIAQIEKRLYMGTINGTERLVGWYPKATLVGDFDPIGGLVKHQLKGLANYLGLEDLAEGVSKDASIVCGGCGELPEFRGMPYKTLDEILYLYETKTLEKLHSLFESNNVDKKYLDLVTNRINSVQHKNDVFPEYCQVNLKQ